MEPSPSDYVEAIGDFKRARQKAALEQVLGWIRGEPRDLLSYERVRKLLRAEGESPTVLKEIPLDSIVGSVGRYRDFNRSFLPRDEVDQTRWAKVRSLAEGLAGLPPIEVYQIGDSYFVRDGHHRVSVARELGSTVIEAYVTPVQTRVPLRPGDDPSDFILKAELAEFLERTEVDTILPDWDLELTEPGSYLQLEQDIRMHLQNLQREVDPATSWETAVRHWYTEVYAPVVDTIRRHGLLRDFPGRTETDLYLWLRTRQAELKLALGWDVSPEQAADNLATDNSMNPARVASRWSERLWEAIVPEEFASGPPPGDWRRMVLEQRQDQRLFRDIVVPIRGDERGWRALDQGIQVARKERGRLLGLHVRPTEAEADSDHDSELRRAFDRACAEAEVQGVFTISQGVVTTAICQRSRWADLAVMSLAYPPSRQARARLGSGVRRLIRTCPRPLLFTPSNGTSLERPLLAYDASPKADEALFVAAYMVGAWGSSLTIVSVVESGHDAEVSLSKAKEYLASRGLSAELHLEEGDPAEKILTLGDKIGADLILMGGYSASPLLEAVMGSSVDEVLRRSPVPLLMCR